ncbi:MULTISPECIES: type I methionyl aminopeptidase [Microbacterium]|uniref:Methionine aminopeptidase n=1 Tax=Microbacterium hominis TaxID=162426 RepID=A0A134DFK4_9MICO|nr:MULTISPECIES: type I methionyl aminopeptidase [Microbacterium]AUG30682.1 type I methionyl aminopeptidase [Microbacterium hominis]KXC05312.1 methionine aminopeptidase [Microbacterium hominis]QOC26436.1 type I methionyl aminopeptidase [Microbacterium hominis]QOC27615.1 type I methionyl aminopeptidase [Microbacterium hominis]QYF97256.1 type I methionyl aminopeptidase [Microbacterium sp. PAMC21962]
MGLRRSLYKTPAQLRSMVEPGLITAAALDAVRALVAPGVTTAELDAAASDVIVARGAESNFQLVRGYRHTTCISVNDQVVHGIPGGRVLEPGDIVSIDAGAQFKGWNGDSAITVVVPGGDPGVRAARERLSAVTEGSLWAGVAALASAARVGEIGDAVQGYIERSGEGYGILRDYVGHGIGRRMHEGPTVFNYRVDDLGPAVRPGLCLAIEPMVTGGSDQTYVEDDDWTVTTVDGSDGCHWEHSVAVHEGGIWVLTAADGGAASLAPFNVTPTPIP